MKYLKKKHSHLLKNYPNFHHTGSVKGMKKLYYGEDAKLVKCGSWIYQVPSNLYNQVEVLNAN